ncbi:PQQ-binding-like beta-propeller repeat protein [Planctomicrobium sp. SH527]|uniref:PQQ-binding-like beta-propeller repeat protein n=1 Tax=Planctomicrobium sp. SH527 TaxID=3448123 RepID=UPI003F5B5AF1
MILFSAQVEAGDWPEFRGPNGQGHAVNAAIPLNWDDSTNITWKQPIPGVAWSSPVLANGRIYLTIAETRDIPESDKKPADAETNKASEKEANKEASEGEGKAAAPEKEIRLGICCVEMSTGKLLWKRDFATHTTNVEMHKKNSHASPTPILEGDALYVHFGPHGTARLTLDGDIVWSTKLDYAPQHGNGGSPALAGDNLIYCCDGTDLQYCIALSKKTGEVIWKHARDVDVKRGFSFCTPLVITVNGQEQAICPGSGAVIAYSPSTGEEIWRLRYGEGYSVIPRPVYGNGLVYICTGYGKPKLLAIDPTGTGDVTETHLKWTTEKQVPHSPSLLLVDNLLFFVSDKGIARCVDATTGDQHWEERLGGNYSASPLYAAGRVYFQDETGTATVIAASDKFEVLSKNILNPDERTFASYAICDNSLFLRSEKHLYRIETPKR